ncbi:MAG: hypothetical protein P8Z40_02605 [Chloroflexota bacterium]|jgi:hypothetical protein
MKAIRLYKGVILMPTLAGFLLRSRMVLTCGGVGIADRSASQIDCLIKF